MAEVLEPLERLTDMFRRLDGVGKKSAARYAFCVLNFSDEEAAEFARAILAAKTEIKKCAVCQNITTDEICPICQNENRDHRTICVVEDPRALLAIEKTRQYGGVYHVLHGTISPMRGVTPDRLTIKDLLARLGDPEHPVDEVILATNPTVEGEATAMYVAKLIAPLGVKVT
ncbi:MAG: recombination mediator RecR, partial [Clostridiales bacterium]|nr:recombination mediator RecR [Clostridiales bacterium]